MSPPPSTPAPHERFAAMVGWFSRAVMGHFGWDQRLNNALIGAIIDRLRTLKWLLARVAIGVGEGRYAAPARKSRPAPPSVAPPSIVPPSIVPPGRRGPGKPRPPGLMPRHRGWLLPLLPEAMAYRHSIEDLLREPDTVALIAAAPGPLRRPLRSLCWMLALSPPPVLALPRRPPPPPDPPPDPRAAPPRRPPGAAPRATPRATPRPTPRPRAARGRAPARAPPDPA